MAKSSDNKLTVVVFKDNLASRTFSLPLNWLSRLGLILGALALISIASIVLAVRLIGTSAGHPSERIAELEKQIVDLEASVQESIAAEAALTETDETASTRDIHPEEATADEVEQDTQPLIAALSSELQPLPTNQTPSIQLSPVRSYWSGDYLNIRFNIVYSGEEGGIQNGWVFMLARAPGLLSSYPPRLLTYRANRPLIDFRQGEPFSMRRLRPVSAKLGPFPSSPDGTPRTVHVFVIGAKQNILISELHRVPARAGGKRSSKGVEQSKTPPKKEEETALDAKPEPQAPAQPLTPDSTSSSSPQQEASPDGTSP